MVPGEIPLFDKMYSDAAESGDGFPPGVYLLIKRGDKDVFGSTNLAAPGAGTMTEALTAAKSVLDAQIASAGVATK